MPANSATPEEIKAFLKKFKSVWHLNGYSVISNKGKNDHTLLEVLGITAIQRKEEIMYLGPEHYVKGPEEDHSGSSGNIWTFSKKVKGLDIYIKLKIYAVGKKSYGKCLSFHI